MSKLIGLKQNVRLAPFTTLKIGGPARYFISVKTEEELVAAINYARANALEIFILGGGSNIVVSDNGFDGLVIFIAIKGITFDGESVTAMAGEDWDAFVAICVSRELQGVECMSGIPGFVGGTPVQNVGAYGQEVADTITNVRVYDRQTDKFVKMTNAECGFSYRKSIFNTSEKGRYIVVSATYKLNQNGTPNITYRDLAKYFENKVPTVADTRDAVIAIRRAKSMVIDENDPNSQSAGSFFKNPIVSKERYAQILSESGFESIPVFNMDEENVKIPAAWLIENSGLKKGQKFGNAGISSNHSLALVTFDGAETNDIIAAKEQIINRVAERFDLFLEPEPIFVGF